MDTTNKESKMKKFLVILAFLLVFGVTSAQAQGDVDWTDLNSVLELMASGLGGVMVLSFLWSWLAENIPAWHELNSQVKTALAFVFSGAISLVAQVAININAIQDGTLVLNIDMIYHWFMLGVFAWVSSQAAYMLSEKTDYATKS
jgi:zinc transporter ZupT